MSEWPKKMWLCAAGNTAFSNEEPWEGDTAVLVYPATGKDSLQVQIEQIRAEERERCRVAVAAVRANHLPGEMRGAFAYAVGCCEEAIRSLT